MGKDQSLGQAGKWDKWDTIPGVAKPLLGGSIPAPGDKGQHKRNLSQCLSVAHPFPTEVAQNVMFSMDNMMESPAPVWSCCSSCSSTACHGCHFIPTGISQTKAGVITRPCSEVCVGSGIPTVPCKMEFFYKRRNWTAGKKHLSS